MTICKTIYRQQQRYAIAALYYSTNGAGWNNNDGWLSTSHECTWYWDDVFESTNISACDGDDRLLSLALYANNVSGSLPAEVELLTELREVYFGDNSIAGSLPSEIAKLTHLTQITLGNNTLTGTIHPLFGNLVTLESLDLHGTLLTGSLPTRFSELTALVVFCVKAAWALFGGRDGNTWTLLI